MKARVSVVIPHYFVARAVHLRRIAADLRRNTLPPTEILVWNNEPPETLPDLTDAGMTVLQADHNHGCQARLLAAQRATSDYVLFMDNDTTAEPRLIESLVGWAAHFPGAIVTLEGRTRVNGQPYPRWPKTRSHQASVPREVTMSLGRGELVPMPAVQRMLPHFPFGPPEAMDDLWWSACAAWEGIPIYVVPTVRGASGLINLPEFGTGACSAKDYDAQREATIAAIRTREGYPRIWTDA